MVLGSPLRLFHLGPSFLFHLDLGFLHSALSPQFKFLYSAESTISDTGNSSLKFIWYLIPSSYHQQTIPTFFKMEVLFIQRSFCSVQHRSGLLLLLTSNSIESEQEGAIQVLQRKLQSMCYS
jgi:hypothetical protein